MTWCVGIDVGAVSIKVAVLAPSAVAAEVLRRSAGGLRQLDPGRDELSVLVGLPRRTRGQPLRVAAEALRELLGWLPSDAAPVVTCTGSGGGLVANGLGAATCNEFQAAARAIDRLHPEVRTVFEIGGEGSRYLRLEPDPVSGALGILDYSANGDCAAGTGAFLDQQAGRLKFAVEEIGEIVSGAERAAQIAGRCSVFAKSDMIHAQQKGFVPAEVLRGLCNAVATNFKSAVVKGRVPVPPVALLGGVSANAAVVDGLREAFGLTGEQLRVPEAAESLPAVGAALAGRESGARGMLTGDWVAQVAGLAAGGSEAFPRTPPLSLERVQLLRDRVRPYAFPTDGARVDAYLGLDIGSVGTKLVLIDQQGEVVHSIFTRTEGRPIEVVTRCLRELEEAVGWGVAIRGVGTTGSGRELIGELVGADTINDEITAHKTGATFVGDRLLGRRPDTIFEIGGQDSKFISLQAEEAHAPGTDGLTAADGHTDSIVVDFTMNEACAAGTGSFLEERAEELGVAIKDEFARLALASRAPIKLGERCTVFMERDVNTCMQRGAAREDIIAGLAYSIAYNYINRVVRGRHIGECIFFQGGTAYNDAVAAAFSMVCGREIIVPPHNAVLGAIGSALLARDKISRTGADTRFRGYDLGQVEYTLREFACRGCGNQCSVQEFEVAGEKTFWGDKCSDRFRKQVRSERKAVIPDLVALRQELLFRDEAPPAASGPRIGIPLCMYTWDLLPLWRRFFAACGLRVVVSSPTNRTHVHAGLSAAVAEPCFPIIVAHGHMAELVEQGVDYIWVPNLLTTEEQVPGVESYVCPWGQTLPFVLRQAPPFRAWRGRMLCPTLRFDGGPQRVRDTLVGAVAELGVERGVARRAFEAGQAALREFRASYQEAGSAALAALQQTGEPGMVLVGRPYNIHDAGVSLAVARKLREQYGVNVLPIDALPLDTGNAAADINDNMYWAYGRRILAAGKLVAAHANLHIIYVTNFKCGPDSFLKAFIRPAAGDKPFLTLQFDGHSNDAGMMTRCEAYLDSKGILRWWRTCQSRPAEPTLPAAPSTSPKWPTPVPG